MTRSTTANRTAALLLVIMLATAYTRTLAPSITWANGGADSGDLVTAAATFGVAHPTGYPTYLLLARLFMLIPVGDLAYRANLLSATAAVLTTLCVYGLLRRMLPAQEQGALMAASIAALALGVSPLFWSQAVIAEVHALNALFLALIMGWIRDELRGEVPAGWIAAMRPAVIGVALGNHVTIALPAAVWLLTAVVSRRTGPRMRRIARHLGVIGLGLLIYLYLPIAALGNPPVNWGDPRDWPRFWWVVSGQLYQGLAFRVPQEHLFARISAWAGLLSQQFGVLGLALGFSGLCYAPGTERRFLAASAAIAVGYSIFAIGYSTDDSDAYLMPAFLIFVIWIGLGFSAVLSWLGGRWRWGRVSLVVLLAALLLWNIVAVGDDVNASQDRGAIDYAQLVMTSAPTGALVATSNDLDSFPLWYYHHALGQRPDLVVVVEPLLGFDWYRENLRVVYPGLRVPDQGGDDWAAAMISVNQAIASLCRTNLEQSPPLACAPTVHNGHP